MLKSILIGLAALVTVLLVVVATRPADFRITRSTVLAAPPALVFAQVNDFHNWNGWSPWAKLDPAVKNTFGGPAAGIGSTFTWDGNSDVGAGKMTVVESSPEERIRLRMEFLKPFAATHTAEFTFKPHDKGTTMTWTMEGTNGFMGKAIGLIMNCDKMIGDQFEQGFANLKSIVEKPVAS